MSLEIRPLDATDTEALAAWHAPYLAAHTFGREHATPWMLEEVRADLLGHPTGERIVAFGGYLGDVPVVTGVLSLPLLDNLSLAGFELHTHPAHRRRGHGAAMLDHLAGLARSEGRSTLTTEAAAPYDGPPDGAGQPGPDFLRDQGFSFSLSNVMRVLDLPVDTGRLQELAAGAAPYHRDYTLRHFRGPVPEDILLPFGDLIGSLITEAPTGELELEKELFDEARIRADEAVFEASGRTKYTTVAVASDGSLAAYSELVVPTYDPGHVFQWGTLVRPEHRGHRLGVATKVHNVLWLQEQHPEPAKLVTYNADVNQHMIAVNEAMGFRPVERLVEFQRAVLGASSAVPGAGS